MSVNAKTCRPCRFKRLRGADDLAIVEAAKRTGNMQAVASELGLTRERVRQICLKHGFTSRKLRAICWEHYTFGLSRSAEPSRAAPPRGEWKSADITLRMMAQRLRGLRYQVGLSTIKLGKKVGLSPSQISRLETGYEGLCITTLQRLARALNVPPAYFLGGNLTTAKGGLTSHLQACGLAPSKQLLSALRDRRFLAFMERCARVPVGKVDVLTKAFCEG
jgi:transcriptional regulator with XRE-family HTH domain